MTVTTLTRSQPFVIDLWHNNGVTAARRQGETAMLAMPESFWEDWQTVVQTLQQNQAQKPNESPAQP